MRKFGATDSFYVPWGHSVYLPGEIVSCHVVYIISKAFSCKPFREFVLENFRKYWTFFANFSEVKLGARGGVSRLFITVERNI
jgi:hypothetical protein